MLNLLSIQNFVLIEKHEIDFRKGLSALTGETGAGKSILLDALSLILGARSDPKFIRHGMDKSILVAQFSLPHNSAIPALLSETGIESEDQTITIRRILKADGKSQIFLNDQAVSLNLIKSIASHLIDIIGQFQTHSLFDQKNHLTALDDFGDLNAETVKVKMLFTAWKEAITHYQNLKSKIEKAQQDHEYLTHAYQEFEEIDPQDDEETTLLEKRQLLMNSQKIVDAHKDISNTLYKKESPNAEIIKLLRYISRLPENVEPLFANVSECLNRASIELSEAETLLNSLNAFDDQDQGLDEIEERLQILKNLARKHQIAPINLLEKMTEIKEKLTLFKHAEGDLQKAREQKEATKKAYLEKAKTLHEKRCTFAQKLMNAIQKELPPLKLAHAKFVVDVQEYSEEQAQSTGLTRIEFMISTGSGAPPGPLEKIASGGELSRLMLALKLVLQDKQGAETLIFDEIDTGIGGAVATAIGQRLKLLSAHKQIFLVTHSPQIASLADTHYLIQKFEKAGTKTLYSTLEKINGQDRLEELARMLSGAKITNEARAAAQSLIDKSIAA